MDKGINSTRIHVRALGDKTTDEPINRVEVGDYGAQPIKSAAEIIPPSWNKE